MKIDRDLHKALSQYLDNHKHFVQTDKFEYTTYNLPHTMYLIANELDEILLTFPPRTYKVWHRCMSLLKRNRDPVKASTLSLKYSLFEDLVSRNSYYKALKQLTESRLLLETGQRQLYLVNVQFANKLYKPK